MSDEDRPHGDQRLPVAPQDYLVAAHRINVGYELVFELMTALLRAHCPETAHLLLVGAGGGTEIKVFGPANPSWRFTGVDPSDQMLALARATVETYQLADHVDLIHGTVDDLAPAAQYDAVTCCFVLMHLPDDGSKQHLVRGMVQRLKGGAPLLLVDAVSDNRPAFLAAWQQYAEARGTPAAEMRAFLDRITTRSNTVSEARNRELLAEAGVGTVTRFFSAFGISGWIATV